MKYFSSTILFFFFYFFLFLNIVGTLVRILKIESEQIKFVRKPITIL